MTVRAYLLSVPERILRSALGLGAGATRELGQVVLPEGIRRSQLYQNLVDATLRYLIEQVGGVEGVYRAEGTLPDNFLARRTAGNAVELLGIVAFRASPVWVLAALADLSGMGRRLIPEIADALKARGLLEQDAQFTSVDQMLDGLERTSSRLAATINTPPLDVAGLRKEWEAIREEARGLPSASLPSRETIGNMWALLKTESARQERSVFETSSMMAVAAARSLPDGVRWLSASARVGAMRAGNIVGAVLLDHYTQTLSEMRQVGYLAYAGRQFQPYVRAAVDQFSPKRRTLTQRLLEKLARQSTGGLLAGVVCLTLLVTACGGSESTASAIPVGPTAPALPTVPAVPTLILSGVVTDNGQPIENARVDVSGLQACSSDCSFRQFNAGSATTDSAGRYRIDIRRPEEAPATTLWAIARKAGYVQQCVATTTMQTDASLDLRVTAIANLSAARPLSAPGSRTVSGVVFETTPEGKQPVEGASVGWEALLDTVVSETRSDAAGRYLLCGLPLGRIGGVFAQKTGYRDVSYASVEPGSDAVVDMEITRR